MRHERASGLARLSRPKPVEIKAGAWGVQLMRHSVSKAGNAPNSDSSEAGAPLSKPRPKAT